MRLRWKNQLDIHLSKKACLPQRRTPPTLAKTVTFCRLIMLLPAPEWPCAVRGLLHFQANHIGHAAAPRPFRSDPGKNLNERKMQDGTYHQKE